MKSSIKPYLIKASLFAAVVLVLSLLLSFLVYRSTENVRINAVDLVDNRIPVLTSIHQITADLSEQERILYEYYATQDKAQFEQAFVKNKQLFYSHLSQLAAHRELASLQQQVMLNQSEIERLVTRFNDEMQKNEDNWDLLRALLLSISQQRTSILPVLTEAEQRTQSAVSEGHKVTLRDMQVTHNMVLVYGISLMILAAFIVWYLRRYFILNIKNTRLALFPLHNPNAIFSVNYQGEVIFSNPACERLLSLVGLKLIDINQLIPKQLSLLQAEMSKESKTTISVEQRLKDRVLQLNVNWLQEVEAFDIHVIDITDRRKAEQEIESLAFYDQLTHLPNQYKLATHIEDYLQKQQQFALAIFEIQNYSRLVTAVGVDSTQQLLQVFVKAVVAELKQEVLLHHLAEDQFAVLLSHEQAKVLMHKQVQDILALTELPLVTDSGDFFIELNFGTSLYPDHGQSRDTIIQNAHAALAVATTCDHTNDVSFEAEFASALKQKSQMVDKLRKAIDNDELFLVFQPQLALESNKVSGVETLLRWRHNDNIVSPAEFIPVAEQSGLIVPIGDWVLQQACFYAKSLVDKGKEDIVVAVNVSPRQFTHPGFIQSVMKALSDAELNAKNLELEITEGVFLHNEDNTLSVLRQLKSLGLQLSIDDFGTGYSSLSYLKKFPVDKLKIDQAFIRDSHNNNDDKILIKTIIALGKSLGMSLIAEGVELEQHKDYLHSVGCDEIQGYWFSRPLEAEDLNTFLFS